MSAHLPIFSGNTSVTVPPAALFIKHGRRAEFVEAAGRGRGQAAVFQRPQKFILRHAGGAEGHDMPMATHWPWERV